MQPFEFVRPKTVQEALAYLVDNDGFDVVLWGGGTSNTILMKQHMIAPSVVVDTNEIDNFNELKEVDEGLCIGAGISLRDMETSSFLAERCSSLVETASLIGNVRVRNVATLGGHLQHADPAQDLPPLLLVLDTKVNLVSQEGMRTLAIDEFFVDIMETALEPNEMIRDIIIPKETLQARSRYVKFAPRSRDDYCTVGVAASIQFEEDGSTLKSVRIAVGGAGSTAMRIPDAEQILVGQHLTEELCIKAAQIVGEQVEPWDDGRGTADYKRAMSNVWTKRVLSSLNQD